MKLSTRNPLQLLGKGQQPENEDFIYPIEGEATAESRLFIVSDGDQGDNQHHEYNGGNASHVVSMRLASYFSNIIHQGDVDQDHMNKAVRHANEALGRLMTNKPEASGLSASFALVHFGQSRVSVAWVGNCRIYYYNSTHKTLTSSDQWEEDMDSPAPDARLEGSNLDLQPRLRYFDFQDLKPGDFFFLCTKGIYQEVKTEFLRSIFVNSAVVGPEKIQQELSELIVNDLARDNYSSYLLPVADASVAEDGTTAASGEAHSSTEAQQAAAGTAVAAHRINDDPAGKRLTWIVGSVLGVIVLLLLTVAFIESRQKPFKNMMAHADTLMDRGQRAFLDADYDGGSKLFQQADQALDSAANMASSEEERNMVALRQSDLETYLEISPLNAGITDLPLDQLPMGPKEYLADAQEFLKTGNKLSALQAFRNARRKLEANPDPEIEFPSEQVASLYAHAASSLFSQADRDCETILNYYQSAFDLFEPQESEPEWYTNARVNASSCEAALAAMADSTGNTGTTANARTRQAPGPAATQSIEEKTGQQIASSTPAPSSSPEGQRVRSTTETPAMRGTSGSSSASPEALTEMRRLLNEGKRQYVEAKEQNSSFLYRTSADKLEKAGELLDGSGAYLLAYMYHSGLGVEQNDAKALQFAQLSARKHWAAGEYLYGHLLLERKIPRDTTTAIGSLKMAANQYYADAIKRLQELGIQP